MTVMKAYEQEERSEDIVSEPEVDYFIEPCPEVDDVFDELEDEVYIAQLRSDLEDYYAQDRIEHSKNPLPKGYMSLEDFDQLLQKKIRERYAEI
jgi:hypothetical protein